jgi:hypothetical protein
MVKRNLARPVALCETRRLVKNVPLKRRRHPYLVGEGSGGAAPQASLWPRPVPVPNRDVYFVLQILQRKAPVLTTHPFFHSH